MLGSYLRDVIDEFYGWLARVTQMTGELVRRVYTGDVGDYVLYIVFIVAASIGLKIWWPT